MRYSLMCYNPDTGEKYYYKGDSGSMSSSILYSKDREPEITENSQPVIGECMRVGTYFGRIYASQDWWQTTPVEEILESYEDEKGVNVKFKTRSGSYYHWREYTSSKI